MSRRRRTWAALLVAAALTIATGYAAAEAPPAIGAKAAVLMDAASGTVLFAQNAHDRRPVASTTKILTAIVALESEKLDTTVVVSDDATRVEGSSLGLKPGERLPLDTLLTALLLKSANDSAKAIAEHVGGSVDGFAELMNEKAKALGATDSHFTNPNGLYEPDHYSSAYDLALFAREGMKLPRFRELVCSKVINIARPDLGMMEPMINHNKLLWRDDTVDGVKTGYVKESGQCLVASATRDHWQLIAVVLDSPGTYDEVEALFAWGYANFRQQTLAQPGDALGQAQVAYGTARTVPAVCEFPMTAVIGPGLAADPALQVKLDVLRAPVKKGQRVGTAELVIDGRVVESSALVAKEAVAKSVTSIALAWLWRGLGTLLGLALIIRLSAQMRRALRRRARVASRR